MKSNLIRVTFTTLVISVLLSFSVSALAMETQLEKTMPEGGKAVLTFLANPLLTMTETPFTVKLIGGTGTVIADATVSLRLVMPAMAMPLNNPKATWSDGSYRGTAIFTMAGEWQAIMLIQRPGYDLIDLTFDLGEVTMK
jgi:hypothetical protein